MCIFVQEGTFVGIAVTWEMALGDHLDHNKPYGVNSDRLTFIGGKNHLHYHAYNQMGLAVCLRMVDPESYRRKEWISAGDEYVILERLKETGLAPKPYYLDTNFLVPILIEEYIPNPRSFNTLMPLQDAHIALAARAIGKLNAQPITPKNFQFRQRSFDPSYLKSLLVWIGRLVYTMVILRRFDVVNWAQRMMRLINNAAPILLKGQQVIRKIQTPYFHFDGAHCRNTFLRENNTVVFLDWESVSWRRDPSFTAARFLVSVGSVTDHQLDVFIHAFQEVNASPFFEQLLPIRLLERTIADAVWVLYDAAQRRDRRPIVESTNILDRFLSVRELLEQQQKKFRW